MPGSHRYSLKCLKGKNASAPCLLCGKCPNCCGCKDKMKGKFEPLEGEVVKPSDGEECPTCGLKVQFMMGHLMVGCPGREP